MSKKSVDKLFVNEFELNEVFDNFCLKKAIKYALKYKLIMFVFLSFNFHWHIKTYN